MKVSIIVPVYNAEKKLEQALDSIFKQTYPHFEVILVNDGSTDNSLQLCQNYERRYENLTFISIENSGPGAARNVGLAQVTGDYISFLDADDQLAPTFLEEMMQVAIEKDSDIVSCNYYRVGSAIKEAENNFTTGSVDKQGTVAEKKRYEQFKTSSAFGYVWGKLYKTAFIEEHSIRFGEEKQVFLEDTLFNLKAIAFTPQYYVLNEPLYYYHVYEDSLSNKTEDITEQAIRLLENYDRFLVTHGKYQKNLDLLIPLANRVISWSLFKTMENDYSLKNIQMKVRCFSQNERIQKIVQTKGVFKEIAKIPSVLQILLYVFITGAIRYQWDRLLALFFFVNYPIFSIYIKKAVRA